MCFEFIAFSFYYSLLARTHETMLLPDWGLDEVGRDTGLGDGGWDETDCGRMMSFKDDLWRSGKIKDVSILFTDRNNSFPLATGIDFLVSRVWAETGRDPKESCDPNRGDTSLLWRNEIADPKLLNCCFKLLFLYPREEYSLWSWTEVCQPGLNTHQPAIYYKIQVAYTLIRRAIYLKPM